MRSMDTIQPPQTSETNERETVTTTVKESTCTQKNRYEAPLPLWHNSLALLPPTEDSISLDEHTYKYRNKSKKIPNNKSRPNTNISTNATNAERIVTTRNRSLEVPKTKDTFSIVNNNEVRNCENTNQKQKTRFSHQRYDSVVGSGDDVGLNNHQEIQKSNSTSSIQPNRNGCSNIVQTKGYPLAGTNSKLLHYDHLTNHQQQQQEPVTSPQPHGQKLLGPIKTKQLQDSPSTRSVTSYLESLKWEEPKQNVNESSTLSDYGVESEYDYDLQHAAEDDDYVLHDHHHQQQRLNYHQRLLSGFRSFTNINDYDDDDDHHHHHSQRSLHFISPTKKIIKSIVPFCSNTAKALSNSIKELDDILLSATTMMIHTTPINKILFSKQQNTTEIDPELFASFSSFGSIDELGAIWNDLDSNKNSGNSINAEDAGMIHIDQPINHTYSSTSKNWMKNHNDAISRGSCSSSSKKRGSNITEKDHYHYRHDDEDKNKCRMFEC